MPLYWPRQARVYRTSRDAQNLGTVIKGVIVLKPGTYSKKLQRDSRRRRERGGMDGAPSLSFVVL